MEIFERKVVASMTQCMKVYARDTSGVMSSGGGERDMPAVSSNCLRDVMASSNTVVDADADAEDRGTSLLRIKTVRKRFVTAIT